MATPSPSPMEADADDGITTTRRRRDPVGHTDLNVRKLPWDFGDDTPFLWNPSNPRFSMVMNTVSFLAPAFERFIVTSTRAAMRRMDDPDALAEADAFLRQEALHARAHRNHTAALVRRYPGLAHVLAAFDASYDQLLASKPLHYHLAYSADIEATFTPFFNVMLRHRDTLFDNGDPRIAPLFLWHLVEEIEHRSSAKVVYDAVVPFPWYRTRVAPSVFAHILGCFNMLCRAVDEHVPFADRGMDVTEMVVGPGTFRSVVSRPDLPSYLDGVSKREIIVMMGRLVRSQAPHHSPAGEETPPFADEWITAYDGGANVVDWYRVAGD